MLYPEERSARYVSSSSICLNLELIQTNFVRLTLAVALVGRDSDDKLLVGQGVILVLLQQPELGQQVPEYRPLYLHREYR